MRAGAIDGPFIYIGNYAAAYPALLPQIYGQVGMIGTDVGNKAVLSAKLRRGCKSFAEFKIVHVFSF
jgi:hypothetical protein